VLLPFCASAALIVAASLIAGQAVLSLCGRREWSWTAGPVGLALLLAAAGIVTSLDGRGTAVAIVLAALVVVAIAVLVGLQPLVPSKRPALAAALVAGVVAALPFIAAWRIGILGVGLVNDDMASHLLLADWVDARFRPEPLLIDQGYPLGPHSLIAGIGALLGAGSIDVFAGLTVAIPMLTAGLAADIVGARRPGGRVVVGVLVALPYMAAAYLAQEAFKEPILALLLLGFALLLPGVRYPSDAVPLGLIAAGAVYTYSFPGLVWLAGVILVWGGLEWLRWRRRAGRFVRRTGPAAPATAAVLRRVAPSAGDVARGAGPAIATGLVVLLVLTISDWGRIADFTDFRALDPDRANDGGLGNLRGHLAPLEALAIWPTSEFRLSAGAGSLPASIFYAGAALAAITVAFGLPRWVRRHGTSVPAALAAAVLIYVGARAFGTVYTSAKALAIAAPLVVLVGLGGLVEERWRPPGLSVLAAVFALGAALSSFLVLRQAPVGPTDHMDELAEIRPVVQGERVLFLGRDNFVLYELRGSTPFTHVRNFYAPYFVRPNFELREVASKFDFDSVAADKLPRFPYVITTRAAYASGPPPSYEPVLETDSYVLWEAPGGPVRRRPLERGPAPGASVRCEAGDGVAPTAVFAARPVRAASGEWSPSSTVESGAPASVPMDLRPGRWAISLQYDATRPVTLSAPGFEHTIPANLDYRGVVPYWPAGELSVDRRGPTRIEASVDSPPLTGRILGAESVAHLGAIAATKVGPSYVQGASAPHPGLGERIVRGATACGRYGDWSR
jgi:hypothetical protein